MFEASKDPGSRRRSKVYTNSKAAKSSRISLLSAFTVTTTSSGGSGSTVTQESYNRSQHKHRRRKHHQARPRRLEPRNASVDVFDFLVDETSQCDESSAIDPHETEHRDPSHEEGEHDAPSDEDDVDHSRERDEEPEGFYRSLSDSGISVGSSSPSLIKRALPVVAEESQISRYPHRPGHELALIDPRCMWPPYSPQPYPEGYVPPPCPPPPPAVAYDVPVYPYPPCTPYGTPPAVPAIESYIPALTIREPSGQPTKPECFRSFNKISTRLLLQMQDEIAKLEQELKLLDEEAAVDDAIDDRSSSHDHNTRERKLREAEVYDDLYAKIDNYYHALEMMQKVDSISAPATTSDLSRYHKWLESRIEEKSRIRPMISNDLRKFSLAPINPVEKPIHTFEPRYLAYCCLINAVVPLISFKLFYGLLNRLIILSLIVFAGAIAQERLRSTIGRDELTCILVCVCISAFAAICL